MSTLANILAEKIRTHGPLPVAEFMGICLGHETHGYYMKQVPFGREGDFTTAPEISQVFGELIGLHLADAWMRAGAPAPVQLVELGPGRGTLMADILRATKGIPGFHAALSITFVEMSPVLRAEQKARVPEARWADRLADVPPGQPLLLVANEFFDALPARQLVKTAKGWQERHVTLEGERFAPVIPQDAPLLDALVPAALRNAPEGSFYELLGGEEEVALISRRLRQDGGAALIIDYGHARHSVGDTLQAMRQHAYADPFEAPGETDITAHVNFSHLQEAMESAGLTSRELTDQHHFLTEAARDWLLSIEGSPPAGSTAKRLRQFQTLTHPSMMGQQFKVAEFSKGISPTA